MDKLVDLNRRKFNFAWDDQNLVTYQKLTSASGLNFIEQHLPHRLSPNNSTSRWADPVLETREEIEQGERGRSLPPTSEIHVAVLTLTEARASAMSGKSPGSIRRKARPNIKHFQSQTEKAERAQDHGLRPTVEIADSDEEYENEGENESVIRIPPKARLLVQHISKALNPAEEERTAFDSGNATEHKVSTPHESKAAKKINRPLWGHNYQYRNISDSTPRYRYSSPNTRRRSADSEQDPSSPPPVRGTPELAPEIGEMKNGIPAGNRPVNRLGGNKVFDLNSAHKRQKTEDSIGSGFASQGTIEFSSQAPSAHHNGPPSTTRSSFSQPMRGDRTTSLDKKTNPTPGHGAVRSIKKRRRSDSFHGEGGQPLTKKINGQTVFTRRGLEDPADPISDDADFQEISKPLASQSPKVPQVVISHPPEFFRENGISSYTGTARAAAARSRPLLGFAQRSGPHQSPHFDVGRRNKRSMSADVDELSAGQSRSTQTSRANISSKKTAQARSTHFAHKYGERASSTDSADIAVGDDLYQKSQSLKASRDGVGSDTGAFHDVSDDESEDDLASIHRTPFNGPREQNLPEKSEKDRYDVLELFSAGHIWLDEGGQKTWSLALDLSAATLGFTGEGALNLTTQHTSIKKIEFSPHSPRIVIHKSKDRTFEDEAKLYVLFASDVHRDSFIKRTEQLSNDLKRFHKTVMPDYLKNVFKHMKEIALEASLRPSYRPANEVEFLQKKQEQMASRQQGLNPIFDKALRDKHPARPLRVIDGLMASDVRSQSESKSAQGERKTRSSSTTLNTEAVDQRSREIPIQDFYGTATSNQQKRRSLRPLARRPSSPPRKERSPSPPRWSAIKDNKVLLNNIWKTSVHYPPEGKKKATVDKQDVERLDEGQFLNDNLISFYLRYLEEHLDETMSKRVYFQNTFFYERLTSGSKGKINFEAVRRWTSKIDLFDFDYIIVPVNENSHWYLAIICNPKSLRKNDLVSPMSSQIYEGTAEPVRIPEEVQDNKNEPGKQMSKAHGTLSGFLQQSSDSPVSLEPTRTNQLAPEVEESLQDLNLHDKDIEKDSPNDSHPHISNTCLTAGEASAIDVRVVVSSLSSLEPVRHIEEEVASKKETPGEDAVEDQEPAMVVSDLPQEFDLSQNPVQQASQSRKKNKAPSLPRPEKYDPLAPRIITLDSLGLKHPACCSHLKLYLAEEHKDKHSAEIDPPGSIGMAALNMPQQDNYCDCGLFLLSYVETFLAHPEEFIKDIVLRRGVRDHSFRQAPEMRNHIRSMLFDLQDRQNAIVKPPKSKAKVKKKVGVANTGQETEHAEARQCEISWGSSNSPASENARTDTLASNVTSGHRTPTKGELQTTVKSRKSQSINLDISPELENHSIPSHTGHGPPSNRKSRHFPTLNNNATVQEQKASSSAECIGMHSQTQESQSQARQEIIESQDHPSAMQSPSFLSMSYSLIGNLISSGSKKEVQPVTSQNHGSESQSSSYIESTSDGLLRTTHSHEPHHPKGHLQKTSTRARQHTPHPGKITPDPQAERCQSDDPASSTGEACILKTVENGNDDEDMLLQNGDRNLQAHPSPQFLSTPTSPSSDSPVSSKPSNKEAVQSPYKKVKLGHQRNPSETKEISDDSSELSITGSRRIQRKNISTPRARNRPGL